jgi:transcription antitermination factor NusG
MPRAPKTPSLKENATTDRAEPNLPRPAHKRARAKGRPPAHTETPSGIELGARVRVVEGPFSGKRGVVHELDAKGGARVKLGLLLVRFELEHLTPQAEARERPVLGTSHRKPVLARS